MEAHSTAHAQSRISMRRRALARLGAVGFIGVAVFAMYAAHGDMRAAQGNDALMALGSAENGAERAALFERMAPSPFARSNGEMFDVAAQAELMKDEPNLDIAEAHTREALKFSPARTASWARLADINVRRHGALTPEGLSALNKSFTVSPFGAIPFQRWRLRFAINHWDELDDNTRRAAIRQVHAIAFYPGENRNWVRRYAASLPPGPARIALNMAIAPYD